MEAEYGVVFVLERIASFVTPLLQLSIVAVLRRRRLIRMFRWFVVYLIADTIRSTLLWVLGGSTFAEVYRDAWIWSEPVMLALHIALVLELIHLLYNAYPGIHSFAKIVISVAVIIAVLLTLLSSPLDIHRASRTASDLTLLRFFQVERVLDLMLALIVAVTVGLFPSSRYAGKRVRRHGFVLGALFASASAGFLLINYGFDSDITGLVTVSVQLLFYVMWIRVFLAAEPIRLPIPSPDEIARVEQWNDDLLALARWLSK